jgi:hypothetical protein
MDADAALLHGVDELLEVLAACVDPVVAGLLAHVSPFSQTRDENNATWRSLLATFGFPEVPLEFCYSQQAPEQFGNCPPYFNYGFIAFNRLGFQKVQRNMRSLTEKVVAALRETPYVFFSAQIALTLAILQSRLQVLQLGPEYNCPNSDEMLSHGLSSASVIRVLHYLRKQPFDRHHFLCDPEAFAAFSTANFDSAILRRFQAHVLSLPEVFYAG